MKKFYIATLVLLLLCIHTNLLGQTQEDKEIIFYTFNAQWEKADSLLDAKIQAQPDNPKYYYMKCPFYFYTRYFNDGTLNGDSLLHLMVGYAEKTGS